MTHSTLLDAALSMAERGWYVFPCLPGRKQPALRVNWQEIATTNPTRLRTWWRRTPYNIGIACGPSGLVVIDLDSADHGTATATANYDTPNGRDNLTSLCIEHGDASAFDTMIVHTPSGYHLYFQAPEERIPNSAGKLAPLVDVRGNGGYVVAPGSRTLRGFY